MPRQPGGSTAISGMENVLMLNVTLLSAFAYTVDDKEIRVTGLVCGFYSQNI